MTGTLSLSVGTPVQFSRDNRLSLSGSTRSGRKLAIAGRNPCKAVAVQAFPETAPAVLKTRKPDSLYEVLRVNRNASLMEIKAAYRSLAKMYHPDACLHPESPSSPDGRDFIEIHNAYATLSDPEARALYDLSLRAGSRRRPFGYAATAAGNSSGFYRTRRWETDQCW